MGGYAWFECDPHLEAILFAPLSRVLEPYWARENGIIWKCYRSEDIRFPFARVEAPPFAIELSWDIRSILRHIGTWSAYKRAATDPKALPFIADIEQDSVAQFESSGALPLRAPLFVVSGRVS